MYHHLVDTFIMSTDQFYELWEKFALSSIVDSLPEDIEKFCDENEITIDYYIQEFI